MSKLSRLTISLSMKRLLTLIFAAALLGAPVVVHAASDPVYTSWRDNLAVDGWDPVTFHSGKPQPGKSEWRAQYQGAVWLFYSEANRDLFLTNPEVFAPQYGGYCAWALARGKLEKGRAEYWHVEDGKLYLNYNRRIKRRWDNNRTRFIEQANDRWPAILAE